MALNRAGMTAAEELREQLARVESGWVSHTPLTTKEACLLFWYEEDGAHVVSTTADWYVETALAELHGGEAASNPIQWNDGWGTREKASAVLQRALELAEAEESEEESA